MAIVLMYIRRMKFCPVCGNEMRIRFEPGKYEETYRVCLTHGLGRVVLNEKNEPSFVFETFDV